MLSFPALSPNVTYISHKVTGLALLNLAKGLHPHLEKNSKISFFGNKSIVAVIVTGKIQLVLHAFWRNPCGN